MSVEASFLLRWNWSAFSLWFDESNHESRKKIVFPFSNKTFPFSCCSEWLQLITSQTSFSAKVLLLENRIKRECGLNSYYLATRSLLLCWTAASSKQQKSDQKSFVERINWSRKFNVSHPNCTIALLAFYDSL